MSNDNQFDKDQEAADKEPQGDSLSEEAQRTLEDGRAKLKIALRKGRREKKLREQIENNVERRNTAVVGFHREGFDAGCLMCRWAERGTPEEKEATKDIHFAYISGMKFAQMKALWPSMLTPEIKRHARAHKWFYDKAKATEEGWSLIIRKGMQRILTGSEVVDPNQLIEALKHVDKREGKIVDLSKTEGNVTIVLDTGNVPKPQPARGIATQSNDTSNDVRLLTPTTVTVIEETPSEEMARTVVGENGVTVAGDDT